MTSLQRLVLAARTAWFAFALALLCVGLSLLVQSLGARRDDAEQAARGAVVAALYQGGLDNPQLQQVLVQAAADLQPLDLLALVNPATGKVVASVPPEFTGKPLQDLSIAGLRLPSLAALTKAGALQAHRTAAEPRWGGVWGINWDRVVLQAFAFSRWSPTEAPLVASPGQLTQLTEAVLVLATPPAGVTLFTIVAGILGTIAGVLALIYWLAVAWWVFQDARERRSRPLAWGLLALLTNAVGLAVYLVTRNDRAQCPTCGHVLRPEFRHCPHCGTALGGHCQNCGRSLQPHWGYCPDCGTGLQESE